MGYYINPEVGTKEAWLAENGSRITAVEAKEYPSNQGRVLVCLVDNGPFTAAGIAFDDEERDAFMDPDGRPKKWFLVKRELLKPFCSLL